MQHLLFESSRVVSERQRGTAKDSVSLSLSVGVICKVTSELRLGLLHGRCATFTIVPRVVSERQGGTARQVCNIYYFRPLFLFVQCTGRNTWMHFSLYFRIIEYCF